MKIKRISIWLAMVAVAGLQTAALAYMVFDRASLLENGREVVLDVKPVDPRSLFRGDYVILNYGDIARVKTGGGRRKPEGQRTVYVRLAKIGEGWVQTAVEESLPDDLKPNEVALRGTLPRRYSRQVKFGIESYFVPEGKGKRLEKLIGKGQLKVIAAVAKDGRVAIKGLEVEGRRVYEERLY
ncbi:MAG: GDYXXLXY domain-containing protein [Alphaproteobacteria bacterium]|nr:GDYXXLXY domain-containing protein [Alphaproteobacteria bacterium]